MDFIGGCHSIFVQYRFEQLFCVTYIMLVFSAEQFPYTSIPFLILEYMNTGYNSLPDLFMTIYLWPYISRRPIFF